MATHLRNKRYVDVAADNGSADSLSFAGLVCIQDQQPKSPPRISTNQVKNDVPEFEFSRSVSQVTGSDASHSSPPGLLVGNGRNHSHIVTQSLRGSSPARRGGSRRPGENTGGVKVSHKPQYEAINQANKKPTAKSSWFGQKLCESFVSPCKRCRAITPTVKSHTRRGENLKLH